MKYIIFLLLFGLLKCNIETIHMRDEYLIQIMKGCNSKCLRVFCFTCSNEKCSRTLSGILSIYGDKFSCKNISNTIAEGYKLYLKSEKQYDTILDLYFYINSMLEERNIFNKSAVEFRTRCNKKKGLYFYSIDNNLPSLLDAENFFSSKELIRDRNNHFYCKFLKKNFFIPEELHLIEGLLYLILEKFSLTKDFFLRSFAIRIFNVVSKYKKIRPRYSYIFSKIFFDIQTMYEEITSQFTENCEYERGEFNGVQNCSGCFLNPKLALEDYIASTNAIINILEEIKRPDVRENSLVENFLDILKILYLTNEKIRYFNYEHFYLNNFSSNMDVNEEFKYYKGGEKSIFKYTFILPLSKKYDFIKYENSDLVKESLQETFFRALFEGEKVPYFFIRINRKTIYRETLNMLKETNSFDLRKHVKVTFDNEEGQDQGGIKKEYFQLLSEEIREERRLFEARNTCIWFRKDIKCQKSEFVSIGKIIGIALYNDVVLNLPFPTLFFKRLLNKDTELADLEEIEPSIFRSLKNMLGLSQEEIKECDQNFEISYEVNNKIQRKLLIKNGNNIKVTSNNVKVFVEKYSKFLTADIVEPYIKCIRRGFLAVIQPTSFEFLHSKELEKIIVGHKLIDIKRLKESCIYKGYNPNSNIVRWFWEIFDQYSIGMKEKLLQFCTGNDRIPITGDSLKIIVMRNGCDTNRLPSAQTCFNVLMIPEYSSKKKLAEKLKLAINYTKGFYLI